MKKWLDKLLKRNPPSAVNISTLGTSASIAREAQNNPTQLRSGLQRSPPAGQKKTDQPLEALQKLSPLNATDINNLGSIPHKTLRYSTGAVIFLQGDLTDVAYYLFDGAVELHPDTDDNFDLSIATPIHPIASYTITANTVLATFPLNSGRLFGATAIAKSNVDIIIIPNEILQLCLKPTPEPAGQLTLNTSILPQDFSKTEFFKSFAQAYHKNKLHLPSLPNVAIKLRNAMQGDISIREAVSIIQMDPAIVTKLIQVANSPLYAPTNSIKNCHDAITRLGLDATRNLVIGINLKQLFHCKNKQIMAQMQATWRQSLLVSSLCFVLAEEVGSINPEEALLAGLINDIGIIPLLNFAETHLTEQSNLQQIIDMLPYLRAPVGRMVLNSLDFSEELTEIPFEAENWFYDSGEKIQLIDIVILAKLHSYMGTEKAKELPYINSIPAYAKLKNGKLSQDFSLAIIHKAQQRINETMSILA
ncbi:MAG: HDOD domain-containing protein [Methylococcaceae bacterium]|nr:HDOD domain-containing protein [Methylococcaceae bacterium]